MADNKTTWIMELKDLVSRPAKTIKKVVESVNKANKESVTGYKLVGREAVEAFSNVKKGVEDLEKSISRYEKQIARLEKERKGLAGEEWHKKGEEIKKVQGHLKYVQEQYKEAKQEFNHLSAEVDKFSKRNARLDLGVTAFNQLTDVVDKFSKSLDFSANYKGIERDVQLLTGLTDAQLTEATSKAYKLEKVYGVAGKEIAKVANGLEKSFGISFSEAQDKIEEGLRKGANLSGNMLSILSEHGPLMQEMGYSLDDVIVKMIQLEKEGIDTSRAFNAIWRGGVELKKMTESQQKALADIGILPEDLKGKTIKEAIEAVGAALDASGATLAEKQSLMTSMFRRHGEKMGQGLVTALFDSASGLDELPVIDEAGSKIKGFMADVQSWVASTMGSFAIGLQQLAPVFTGIGSGITLFQQLTKVTWLQNVATKALSVTTGIMNAIAMAGPWGWVALAIGAVVSVVALLSNKFEWAAGVVGAAKASFKDFGSVILQMVLLPMNMVIASLGAIGKAIKVLLKSPKNWGGAVDALKGASAPVQKLMNSAGKFGKNVAKGYSEGENKLRDKKASTTSAGTTGPDGINDAIKVDFDSKTPEGGGSKGSSKGSGRSGMSISGTGSGKALTMHLNIVNNFNGRINSREDIRELAEEVMGVVVDRSRDIVLSI